MENKTKFLLGGLVFILLVITITGIWIKNNSESKDFFAEEIPGTKLYVGEETHSYTSSTETVCNSTGSCTTAIYSSTVFSNESGGWYPLPALANVAWESGGFNFSYRDYWFLLEPFVVYNGNPYTIAEIKEIFPNINLSSYVNPSRFDYKYALNFTNIPENLANNTDWIGLRIAGSNGLTWDDITLDGYNIIIKDKVYFDFGDLIESGYTLNRINKSVLLIGNISEHWDNGNIYLDPTIVLDGLEGVLEDGILYGYGPDRQAGAGTVTRVGANAVRTAYSFIKWNITSIPSDQQIDNANLSFHVLDNTIEPNEGFDLEPHYVFEFPTYNISDLPWWEGNNTEVGIGSNFGGPCVENMACWNTMPNNSNEINQTADSTLAVNDTFPAASSRFNITVTGIVAQSYANGDENLSILINATNPNSVEIFDYLVLATKENPTAGLRPILYITHSAISADNPPSVTLSTPIDDTSDTTTDYNFTCNVTDDFNITNTSILVWRDNGTLFNTSTNTSTGTSLNYSFVVPTLDIDSYVWNCESIDNESQSARATENFSLTVTAADTCNPTSPLSANYIFECSDNCNQTSALDAFGFVLNFNGTGSFSASSEILNFSRMIKDNNCRFIKPDGVKIWKP